MDSKSKEAGLSDPIWVECGNCENETKHQIRGEAMQEADLEGGDGPKWFIIGECLGCEAISFIVGSKEIAQEGMEDTDFEFENVSNSSVVAYEQFEYLDYEDQDQLPRSISNLYDEIKVCMENESEITAGLGLRTLIEAICMNKSYVGGNLKLKIAAMRAAGVISDTEERFLQKLREIGNASAHDIKRCKLPTLGRALQIMNHVLRSIYILPKLTDKVKA